MKARWCAMAGMVARLMVVVVMAGCFVMTGEGKPLRRRVRGRADRNRDGRVDAIERRRAVEHRAKVNTKWEERADKDGDGVVERAEAQDHFFRVTDRNGDGLVSAAEKSALWMGRRIRVVDVHLKQYDADNDGYLAGEELREWLCRRIEQVSENSAIQANTAHEELFDSNGDGLLDNAEAENIREDICNE